jgi:hypothetical protein
MSQSINIITNSLEYYDTNQEIFDKINSKIKYYKIELVNSDLDHSKIKFFDKNKKELFVSRYEIVGSFNNTTNTWIWAWSIPHFRKNSTFISKKILNYGLDIPAKPENKFLKSELVTSRFRIADHIQLDLHVAIASYISKNPFIFKLILRSDFAIDVNESTLFEVFNEYELDNSVSYVAQYLFLLDNKDLK